MQKKTISRLKRLSNGKTFSVKYEEVFNGSRGHNVTVEVVVGGDNLHWTNKIPMSLFWEIRKDAFNASFQEAVEEIGKLTNKYFTVSFDKIYYSDGTKSTECGVYVTDAGYFYSDNFNSSIRHLKTHNAGSVEVEVRD